MAIGGHFFYGHFDGNDYDCNCFIYVNLIIISFASAKDQFPHIKIFFNAFQQLTKYGFSLLNNIQTEKYM